MSFKIEVQTPKGRGILGHDGAPVITVTDLGYVMLKVWYPETDSYVNYRLSDIKESKDEAKPEVVTEESPSESEEGPVSGGIE